LLLLDSLHAGHGSTLKIAASALSTADHAVRRVLIAARLVWGDQIFILRALSALKFKFQLNEIAPILILMPKLGARD
jgi:hypothetical protein